MRLEDERGSVGWGEAAHLPGFGTETMKEIVAACAALGPEPAEAALAGVPVRLGCLRAALGAAGVGQAAGPPPGQRPGRPDYLPVAALLPAGRSGNLPLY